MQKKYNVIKIDVDGVIRDLFSGMCELYNKTFNTLMTPKDIIDYDTDISFPLIKEKLGMTGNYFFFDFNGETIFKGKVIPRAKEAIDRLHESGLQIEICTYQPNPIGRLCTLEFLESNKIYFDGLHFTRDKFSVKGDVLIDDAPWFISDEKETADKICVRYPFNKDFRSNCVTCVDSLSEAVDFVLETNRQFS